VITSPRRPTLVKGPHPGWSKSSGGIGAGTGCIGERSGTESRGRDYLKGLRRTAAARSRTSFAPDPAALADATEQRVPDDTLAAATTPTDLDPHEAASPPFAAKRPWRKSYVVDLRWALFDEERRGDRSEFIDALEFIRRPRRKQAPSV
jgi:hypothetical protein